MRTYRAELAPYRLEPLHSKYVDACYRDAERRRGLGPRDHAYETTCPYCGVEDRLVGVVQIGAKERVTDVPMTREGYERHLEDVGDRDTEVQIIHCQDCEAAVDPLAYFSPAVFYADKEDEELF